MLSGNVQSAVSETVSAATSVTHITDPIRVLDNPANYVTEQNIEKEAKVHQRGSEDMSWEHDPINPRNWSTARKWVATALVRSRIYSLLFSLTRLQVSLYTFVAPLGSSMMAPGLPEVALKYHITNPTILALTLSIFLLSFAIGPLFLAPLSEMYGRAWASTLSLAYMTHADIVTDIAHRKRCLPLIQSGLCLSTDDKCAYRLPLPW